MELSRESLFNIFGGQLIQQPILQIIGMQFINVGTARLKLSDGVFYTDRTRMKATASPRKLKKFDKIRIMECRFENNWLDVIKVELIQSNIPSEIRYGSALRAVGAQQRLPAVPAVSTVPVVPVVPVIPAFPAVPANQAAPAPALAIPDNIEILETIAPRTTDLCDVLTAIQTEIVSVVVQVMAKSGLREYVKNERQGVLFNFLCEDNSARIRVISFDEVAQLMTERVPVNGVIRLTNFGVQQGNERSTGHLNFELLLLAATEVEIVNDILDIQQIVFTNVADLYNAGLIGTVRDVIGICEVIPGKGNLPVNMTIIINYVCPIIICLLNIKKKHFHRFATCWPSDSTTTRPGYTCPGQHWQHNGRIIGRRSAQLSNVQPTSSLLRS